MGRLWKSSEPKLYPYGKKPVSKALTERSARAWVVDISEPLDRRRHQGQVLELCGLLPLMQN
ncbi:hypothetical protein PSYMO_34267 [Pseudomonas amygdali pv. mori str. 301020]|uniref:Uncharacterized protein n=2 Tax=Pseudomonas amygdali pv. mori TaxID=34065 RepID=A0A3M5J889_PSEA0|nr:hypothetical protein PSYMO_34267 [Pseudomonas amygdali pv. mori str. 301020]QOI07988.1 hypothetical protein D5S10_30130 [Pseudomonas savastanoi]RMT19100.1 hypothetical protein ALP52_01452 [Pseudomonas amygdali pv. mori]